MHRLFQIPWLALRKKKGSLIFLVVLVKIEICEPRAFYLFLPL